MIRINDRLTCSAITAAAAAACDEEENGGFCRDQLAAVLF